VLESHAGETADAFGVGPARSLSGPVARGRLGAVWRLDTDLGSYAVKETDRAPDPEAVERDASHQERFRAGGVPMPAVVRTVGGDVLAEVAGHVLRAYTWVDVSGEDRRLDPAAVGRLLATAHRVEIPPDGPVDPWFCEPVGPAAWESLVEALHAAGAAWAERLADLVPGLVDAEALIVPHDAPQVCHRDLWADNLRDTPSGLVALDWENAGPADPHRELGLVLFEYASWDAARARALVAAYEETGGPARIRRPEDFSMLLAVQGHLVAEGCRRWLAATSDQARADNAAWVAEFLDEPFLVPQVEAMLSAVRGL
jgi:aminoglycoside phosphotransferase (APT) family kinase protein